MRNPLVIAGVAALSIAGAAAHAEESRDDAQRIETGRRVYLAQCAACHGVRGEGQPDWDRPDAAGDLPAPPHDREGHTWKHSDAMLYRIVRNGFRDPFNKSSRLTMPAFASILSPGETHDVIQYLKTLWTDEQRAFQREESLQAPFPREAR